MHTHKRLLISAFTVILFSLSALFSIVFAYGSGTYGGCTYGVDCPSSTSTTTYSYTTTTSTSSTSSGIGDDADVTITYTSSSRSSEELGEGHYIIKIVDENGNPISGARIVIEELGIEVTTDEDGFANLGLILNGEYDMEVTYNGQTHSEVLSLTDSTGSQILITINPQTTGVSPLLVIVIIVVLLGVILILLWRRQPRDNRAYPTF